MKRLTQKDWQIIIDALNFSAADAWDVASYGPRPDFEAVIEKVQERICTVND